MVKKLWLSTLHSFSPMPRETLEFSKFQGLAGWSSRQWVIVSPNLL